MDTATSRRQLVFAIAVIAPLVVCATLTPFRDSVANTNAALVLVLVVVAVAATGVRLAGAVAALSSGLWFDFFLTEPFQCFTITDRADLETTVLLVVVGVGVTELALWGRRQQGRASVREGYLSGIVSAANTVATGSSPPRLVIEHVGRQIKDVLGIDDVRFDEGPASERRPRLNRDGTVVRAGHDVDVERHGLPVDDEIELPVEVGGSARGRFLLTASTSVGRPDLEQRQVAVALADPGGAGTRAEALSHRVTQPAGRLPTAACRPRV